MEQIYVLYLINVHNFMPDISNTLNYMHVAYKQWIRVHTEIEIFSFWTPIKHFLEQLIEINKSSHNVKPKQLNIYSKLRQSIKLSIFLM